MKCCMSAVLALVVSLFCTAVNGAAPDFTGAQKQALLEFAHSCLTARLAGNAAPVPPEFATRQQRACFVTFFSGKRVVACFGGFSPRRPHLAEEIDENVRLALKNDVRARSLSLATARNAGVQITFPLGPPERAANYQTIDPLHGGIFVEGSQNGVAFVPGEARTAAWAVREALRRLGESSQAKVAIYRFKAVALSTRQP